MHYTVRFLQVVTQLSNVVFASKIICAVTHKKKLLAVLTVVEYILPIPSFLITVLAKCPSTVSWPVDYIR